MDFPFMQHDGWEDLRSRRCGEQRVRVTRVNARFLGVVAGQRHFVAIGIRELFTRRAGRL